VHPPARVVVSIMRNKDKEFADRLAYINQQVQTGDVNFEQAKVLDWSMRVGMGPLNLNETYSYLKQGN
jgi:hypothetical protein